MVPNIRKVQFSAGEHTINNIRERLCREVYKEDTGENVYSVRFRPDEITEIMQVLSSEKDIVNINFHEDTLDIIIELLLEERGIIHDERNIAGKWQNATNG